MVPEAASMPTLAADSPWRRTLFLAEVIGGEATDPTSHSGVGNKEFAAALQAALLQEGLLGSDESAAPFRLKAVLIDVSQPPEISFTMTINSAIRYLVTRVETPEAVFDEVITTSFTATAEDEFFATERLRMANEGAVRANIAEFLSRLANTNVAFPPHLETAPN